MSVIKLIPRWSTSVPTIVVDRHAPPATGKLTKDAEGDYVLFDDLLTLFTLGAVIEYNKDVRELVQDGQAHRNLMTDLEQLGYDDFDQVMAVLKEKRDSVIPEQEFEIWAEGYAATGEISYAHLVGKAKGRGFYDACKNHYNTLDEHTRKDWKFERGRVSIYGMGLYATEQQARRFLGYPEERRG